MPTLEAVVESPNPRIETWVALPEPSPFYKMIRLSASASPDEVAMIVAQLTYYKKGAPALTMEQVVRESFHILPGGLQAVDGDVVIEPSCCCGLEEWRDWLDLLEGGPSPWLGHDPAPWVEKKDDRFIVHSHGGLGSDDSPPTCPESRIVFTRQELRVALEQVQKDLIAFLSRLDEWARKQEPALAGSLVAAFDYWFQVRHKIEQSKLSHPRH